MPEAERVIVTDDTLTAELSDGRTIAVPRSYAEYGDDTPTLSTRFGLVEVEVPAPQAAQAG